MLKRLNFLFSILLILLVGESIAQEVLTKPASDSLYREDQFYVGASFNVLSNVPDGVKRRGLSGGFQLGYLRDMPINERRNVAIAIGAGFAFDQYGQNLFIGESGSDMSIYRVLEDNAEFETNRFSTATIEAPFEIRWRNSTPESYKFWRVYAGMRVGYVYWYRAKFKQPGNNIDQTDIPEFDRVRFTGTLSFGWNTVSLFAHYSINPFFSDAQTVDGQALDFRTIKLGLMFYIL